VSGSCETTNNSYNLGFECQSAKGCCDIPEVCKVGTFTCPVDLKYGDTSNGSPAKTCRAVCASCAGDVEETCNGGSDDCTDNILLDDKLCIKAGQNYDAGHVSVVGTVDATGDNVQVCAQMTLDPSWSLVGSESIKAYFSTGVAPPSSPGQYPIKLDASALSSGGQYTFACTSIPICEYEPTTLYFAIHLDVTGVGGGQTAWALPCANSILPGGDFTNKSGKGKQGWGQFLAYTPCCPSSSCTDDVCLVPVAPPVAAPSVAPAAAPAGGYSCACACDASNAAVDATCAVVV
jgi:hypothetical protein